MPAQLWRAGGDVGICSQPRAFPSFLAVLGASSWGCAHLGFPQALLVKEATGVSYLPKSVSGNAGNRPVGCRSAACRPRSVFV